MIFQRWDRALGRWVVCDCICHKLGPLSDGEEHDQRVHDRADCRGWHRFRYQDTYYSV